MIANSQFANQVPVSPAGALKGEAVSKSDGTGSEFKALYEQGLAAEKNSNGKDTAKAEAGSSKQFAKFDARDPFAETPQLPEIHNETIQETGELTETDPVLGAGAAAQAADDTRLALPENSDGITGTDVKVQTGLEAAAAEENVRSIINALRTKADAEQSSVSTVAGLPVGSEQKVPSDQIVKSAFEVLQAGAASVKSAGSANASSALSAMAAANNAGALQKQNDSKTTGFDKALDGRTASTENGALIAAGKGIKENTAMLSASEREESPVAFQHGYENRKIQRNSPYQAGTRVEASAMTAMQGSAQAGAAQNIAPPPAPPVKDQVLDRLAPEIRTMHGADAAGSTQSQAGAAAAANRNIISLQLYPIGLGRVQAVLTKGNEGVKIELFVENRKTLDLLNADIDALKTSMRALGASDDNINIALGRSDNSNDDAGADQGKGFDAESQLADEREGDANGGGSKKFDSDNDAPLTEVQSSGEGRRTEYNSTRMVI